MIQDSSRFRWRLVASCVLLVGIAFIQSPGSIVPDTKLDLVASPFEFLGRAAHLWDAEGTFGQLQNQAYGYLWPMGPFFALGSLLDLPGWVIQRLWMALVLCVAFVGAARLLRALGVRSDLATLVAATAFALSPRMLTVIGPSSIEVWPSALAPWVLLPLVVGARTGSPRRAAALSALAIAMVGGVNAAATSAVLPLGALWLLTRERGPRRRSLMLWWPTFTLVATAWWLIPLFLLGSYSPPFLDYIETASNTTFTATLYNALRGTSDWVPYVTQSSRAGNDLLRLFHLALNSGVVLAAGLLGLLLRRNPHRTWLLSGLFVGLFLVTMGHTGSVSGGLAGPLQEWLDGPLAPLRNAHKFDPVVRLPLIIGLAWTLDWLLALGREATGPQRRSEVLNHRVLAGIVTMAVLVTVTPAIVGRMTPSGDFNGIPDYWAEAAEWLGEEQDQGTALLLPGSAFGTYVWGSPGDEPMQALARKPWAVRSGVPLTPPGTIRMLDAIGQRIDQGRGGVALADYLRRAGISHLVVRNDLARGAGATDPVVVHQAIQATPGLRPATTFGPVVGGSPVLVGDQGRSLVNGGWQNEYPAIEIYTVSGTSSTASVGSEPPLVVGGPEDLLDLMELGVLADQPTQLASDLGTGAAGDRDVVLTDGLRAVDRSFGQVRDSASSVRTQAEIADRGKRRDYTLEDPERWSTVAAYRGVDSISASDSLSEIADESQPLPGAMPSAAIDGHVETSWTSGRFGEEHWWQVDFEEPTPLAGTVTLTAGPDADQTVVVRTPDFESQPIDLSAGEPVDVAVDDPAATWLRIEDASGRTATSMSLSEVEIPGVEARRVLELPELPDGSGTPAAVVLRAMDDDRLGCALINGETRCVPGRVATPEEPLGFHRGLTLPASATFQGSLMVRGRPGRALEQAILTDRFVDVAASSVAVPDVRGSGLAAVDGSDGTTWSADVDDERPQLRFSWLRKQTLSGITVTTDRDVSARVPQTISLSWPEGNRVVEVGETGSATFAPIRTDRLTLRVESAASAVSLGFDGAASAVPIGITELRLEGIGTLPLQLPLDEVDLPCGSGPEIVIDGQTHPTRVQASPAQLMAGVDVPATLCGTDSDDLVLPAGAAEVSVTASEAFTPRTLVLSQRVLSGSTAGVESASTDATHRTFEPSSGLPVLATTENVNRGWRASQAGVDVEPVVLDGWRQGYRLGGDSGATVRTSFGPDLTYRLGLGLGLLAALLLAAGCVVTSRRRRTTGPAPLGPREPGRVLWGAATVATGWLLAGAAGAVVSAATLLVGWLVARRAPVVWNVVVVLCLLTATGAYVTRTWGSSLQWAGDLAWPTYLVLVAVSGVAAVVLLDGRAHWSFSRMLGRSTTR